MHLTMVDDMRMMLMIMTVGVLLPLACGAFSVAELRKVATQNNVTCILVFGDSSVDPGNNNVLHTTAKSNFLPYGMSFFNGRPTGRFSNGRLATDFIADAVGYTKTIPAFLDPNLRPADLPHGVSFASAASGYDELTANFSNVLPLSKQLRSFMHYKLNLARLMGKKSADDTIKNAIFIISMGTNDFVQNYYLEPTRPKQFTVEQYQDYLVSCMSHFVQEMHRLGGTKLILVGVPPFGCMPIVKTLAGETKCVESYNKVAVSLNSKMQKKLENISKTSGMEIAYVDAYDIVKNAINNPQLYGLTETSRGCCGTGTIEFGESCKGLKTCSDPTKYVFWDAVHPTEKIYKIVAKKALQILGEKIFA